MSADKPVERIEVSLQRLDAGIRDALAAIDCPEHYIAAACVAAAQASRGIVQAAEKRERSRIIRWLRSVAMVDADRVRAAQAEDSAYWLDQLDAFSHAAEAIARRRHARPH